MKNLTCIVCPRGCALSVEENETGYVVSGNSCKRGEKFAVDEMTNPMRTICSTVKTVFTDVPVLPVRVSTDIPKAKILDVMSEINKITVNERITTGDAVIKNVCDTGADVIVTSNILTK